MGLDVSQKSTAVCVIDGDGNAVWRGTVESDPQAIDSIIRQRAPEVRRVGMETGPLAVWFYHGLRERGDVCRRLMTVPGVGVTTAVAFAAAVDNPERFRRVSDIGPYLGLTPRKYQSGDIDHNGKISKTGCRLTRHMLFEAASVLLLRHTRDCALQRWAHSLIPRIGLRKALVATTRKLATLLLSIWRSGKEFIPG